MLGFRRNARAMLVVSLVTVSGLAAAATNAGAAAHAKAPGPPGSVTIVPGVPGRNCDGDADLLTWTAPKKTGGKPLLGYHILEQWFAKNVNGQAGFDVGPDVTSAPVTAHFLNNDFDVSAVTAAGSTSAETSMMVERVPSDLFFGGATEADHTINLTLGWAPPDMGGVSLSGGNIDDDTMTLVRHPDEVTTTSGVGYQFTLPITQLNDRVAYSFTSTVTNSCGTSDSATTGSIHPGVAPAWTADTPPLSAASGVAYSYGFQASGKTKPRVTLVNAPAWLAVNGATGVVSGTPPDGTTSFSYSVNASNHVGMRKSAVDAGPFVVTVT